MHTSVRIMVYIMRGSAVKFILFPAGVSACCVSAFYFQCGLVWGAFLSCIVRYTINGGCVHSFARALVFKSVSIHRRIYVFSSVDDEECFVTHSSWNYRCGQSA